MNCSKVLVIARLKVVFSSGSSKPLEDVNEFRVPELILMFLSKVLKKAPLNDKAQRCLVLSYFIKTFNCIIETLNNFL